MKNMQKCDFLNWCNKLHPTELSENWEIGDLITHTNYAVLVVLEVVVVVHVAIAKVHEPRVVGTAL